MALESPNALNQDFNISTSRSTTVLELAQIVWNHINGDLPLKIESDPAFEYDVQKRIPDTSKAEKLLGFSCNITLEEVAEVVDWVSLQIKEGNI